MTRPLDPLTKADRMIRHCPRCGGWVWRGRDCTPCGRKPRTTEAPARKRHSPGLPDDGYIDPIAVERLLAGTLHWLDATPSEREEAGRIALARGDGGWKFCAEVLHLGPSVMRRIRREVAA